MMAFATRHDIPVPVTQERPYSMDRNLFHISYEGGILEDPWAEPPPKMFLLTQSPEDAPDVAVEVTVDYESGNPVAVDGARLDPVALLTRLNRLGAEHGVGRIDLVENRFVGMKSRGVYETPGGTILHAAHRALESVTLDREVLHLRDSLVPRYAEMVYYGFWFAPERLALQTLMDECQRDVTGTVRLKLYKGNVTVLGRRSPRSLYRTDFVTFERDDVYRQRDAEGFINLQALRLKIRALRDHRS
jgi:argininosuccinate synthase